MANENFMKIRKGLNLNPTTLPPTGNVGDLVVDAADNKLKIWNGATWVIVGGLSDIADDNSTGNQPAVPSQNISIIRFTNNTPPTIQGIADGYNTKLLIISYVGLTGQMIIQNDSPSASAANRIITGTGGDISLNFGASLWLYYDGTSSRWRVVGGSGGANAKIGNFITLNNNDTIAIDKFTLLQTYRVQGNSGSVILSNTPFGTSAPLDGTTITLIGNSSTNLVTITNQDISKGCILNGDATLSQYDSITLQYLAAFDRYIEINRNF